MNREIDQDKKEFFKNCEHIVKAPACVFLEGNRFSKKAKVLPIPTYVYAGIEKGNFKRFMYEEYGKKKNIDMLERFKIESQIQSEMPEEELNLVKNRTPISSMINDRYIYYQSFLSEKFQSLLIWTSIWDKMHKEKNYNIIHDRNKKDALFKKLTSKFKDHFKIKIWSEIPSNIGLNEGAAIAAAVSILLNLQPAKDKKSKEKMVKAFEEVRKNFPEEIVINDIFTGMFDTALALDFSSNGAAVFASLTGCKSEQEVIEYEFLVYGEFKNFFKPYPPLPRFSETETPKEFSKRMEKIDKFRKTKGIYAYFDKCLDLREKTRDGLPLFEWAYSRLSIKDKDKLTLLVMERPSNDLISERKLRVLPDAAFSYYQISQATFAVLGDPTTIAVCKKNPAKHIFGDEEFKSWQLFWTIYNSRKQGWGAEGAEVIGLKRVELEQLPKEETEINGKEFLTNYKVELLQDKNGKGSMTVFRNAVEFKIELTKNQIEICLVMARALKRGRNKKIPDFLKGYANYEDFKAKVEYWGDSTTDYQIRTQIIPIKKKIKAKSLDPNLIENKPKIGYRLSTHPDNIIEFKSYYRSKK